MTRQAVFCIGCTTQFTASIQAAYDGLKKKRDIELHVVHVAKADDIRRSEFRSWQPYRIVVFTDEPSLTDIKAVLEEIREVGIPHKLCMFLPPQRLHGTIQRITDYLEATPDPTRVRKLFGYACKKKNRARAIANTLVRAIAQDRI